MTFTRVQLLYSTGLFILLAQFSVANVYGSTPPPCESALLERQFVELTRVALRSGAMTPIELKRYLNGPLGNPMDSRAQTPDVASLSAGFSFLLPQVTEAAWLNLKLALTTLVETELMEHQEVASVTESTSGIMDFHAGRRESSVHMQVHDQRETSDRDRLVLLGTIGNEFHLTRNRVLHRLKIPDSGVQAATLFEHEGAVHIDWVVYASDHQRRYVGRVDFDENVLKDVQEIDRELLREYRLIQSTSAVITPGESRVIAILKKRHTKNSFASWRDGLEPTQKLIPIADGKFQFATATAIGFAGRINPSAPRETLPNRLYIYDLASGRQWSPPHAWYQRKNRYVAAAVLQPPDGRTRLITLENFGSQMRLRLSDPTRSDRNSRREFLFPGNKMEADALTRRPQFAMRARAVQVDGVWRTFVAIALGPGFGLHIFGPLEDEARAVTLSSYPLVFELEWIDSAQGRALLVTTSPQSATLYAPTESAEPIGRIDNEWITPGGRLIPSARADGQPELLYLDLQTALPLKLYRAEP